MKGRINSPKGITLVALVVTIVVLLILAGITITYIMGDNSIFKKAQEAKNKTEEAMKNEQEYLNNLGNTIHDYINGTNTSTPSEKATKLEINSVRARIATGYTRWLTATAEPDTASQKFEWTSSNTEIAIVDNKGVITAKKKGTTTITVKTTDGSNLTKACEVTVDDAVEVTTLTDFQTKNTIAKDENGNLITVPVGFKVLTSQATNVTQGIVIQDSEGNEFVWIPVDSVSKGANVRADDIRLGRYTFDSTNGTPKKEQDADNYKQIVNLKQNEEDVGCQELISSSNNIPAKNLEEFVVKTKLNGGYYFGRYEASQGVDEKVDSKLDKVVWSNITQGEAATAAREMYNSDYIESDLINSYSWDTAILFIQKYSGNTKYSIVKGNSISTSKVNTGKIGDEVCNINDMASNCREWSTESSVVVNEYVSICRGGRYTTDQSTAYRSKYAIATTGNTMSFRPIIYLK